MTTANLETNPATKRHWMYGLNVTMMVAIGIVILTFLLVMGEQTRRWGHWDWTTGGLHSLSGSTKSVLKEISDEKKTYTLLSLFPNPAQSAGEASGPGSQREKYRQVNDLLSEYARVGPTIKVEDAGEVGREDIERRVRDLYATELRPYQEAVEAFTPLARDLSDFVKQEAAAIGAEGQKAGTTAADMRSAAMLQANFSSYPTELEQVERAIRRETDTLLPRWNNLTDSIKEILEGIEPTFALLADPVKLKETDIPAPLVAYFTRAQPGYKKMADELKAYKERLAKLEPLKVQDVLTRLERNSVVILGPDAAKVISEYELYESNASANNPDAGGQTFIGEQAISTALLAMVRPEKIKVVFVSPSPQRLTTEMFAATTAMLQQANFEVLEWSPPSPPSPQNPSPPDSPTPPAQGKDADGRPVVWVVFPPDAPNPQQMMMGMPPPNPQPVIDATRKHLEGGGQALFLAEATAANPMMGMMGGPQGYPYEELLKDFGISVQSKYTIVRGQEGEDPETGRTVRQVLPLVPIERFEDHEITRPLQSLRTIFAFGRGQTGPIGMPTVVSIQSPLPAGVEARVLASTPAGGDYWAESNFSPEARFERESDLASPVSLAVAAIKNPGNKETQQRVVVIGSKLFAADYFLTAAQPRIVGNTLVRDPLFPGNAELMRNTVLWLAGYENMISVSSKAMQAARIRDISPAQLALVRWGVLGGAPIAALVLGAAIYMFRRKN